MVVLDVFIGLVFVYFLYSLFVSILAEMFSTWIGMRSRILRQGIDNFLNDQHPKKHGLFMWLHDLFLVEHTDFRYTTAGKFYNEPSIKYLAKVGENKRYSMKYTKPAYIEKSHFVSAILSMLIRRSIGVSEWDKVKFAIDNNALNLEKDTLQMFKDWMVQSNDSYDKFKAYIGNSNNSGQHGQHVDIITSLRSPGRSEANFATAQANGSCASIGINGSFRYDQAMW